MTSMVNQHSKEAVNQFIHTKKLYIDLLTTRESVAKVIIQKTINFQSYTIPDESELNKLSLRIDLNGLKEEDTKRLLFYLLPPLLSTSTDKKVRIVTSHEDANRSSSSSTALRLESVC